MKTRWYRPLLAGLCVAFSMPPWGWWPLALVGVALYAGPLVGRKTSPRQALRAGTMFGLGWFAPALAWMWFLTVPGYLIVIALFAILHGVAAMAATSFTVAYSRRRALALATTHTLAEAIRLSVPFGGIPLASIGISQADSPLARLAPIGGVLLITFMVFRISVGWGRIRAIALTLVLIMTMSVFDNSHATGQSLRIALIQGGGPQGTRAVNTDFREVFDRHLELTRRLTPNQVDVVVWPENVVNVTKLSHSEEFTLLQEQARRLNIPLVVGVTEDVGPGTFTNAQIVVMPDGSVADRYDKVQRVPFGEYMPFRSLLAALGAPTELVPNDAIAGTGPALLTVNDTKFAVAISWEVFFGRRVNDGVSHDGEIVINPTNGASYTWSILQTQQIASSQLRAREQGRWVAQVAPTGLSAFVDPHGTVHQRTSVSEAAIVSGELAIRHGRTLYGVVGDGAVTAVFVLMLGWLVTARLRRRDSLGTRSH